MERIIDPRGKQSGSQLTLAKRSSLEELAGGRILLFDNKKLHNCNYYAFYDRARERFEELGVQPGDIIEVSETLRGKDAAGLRELAESLLEMKPTAALAAFGDLGMSSATALFTARLEELGVPTVCITAEPGTALAKNAAFRRAGRLCICSVDVYQFSTEEEVRAEFDRSWNYILGALTAQGSPIR